MVGGSGLTATPSKKGMIKGEHKCHVGIQGYSRVFKGIQGYSRVFHGIPGIHEKPGSPTSSSQNLLTPKPIPKFLLYFDRHEFTSDFRGFNILHESIFNMWFHVYEKLRVTHDYS
jgi:hypothetical protein